MRTTLSIIALAIWLASPIQGQQNMYKWRLGIHGGTGFYLGDLGTGKFADAFHPQPLSPADFSYGAQIEYLPSKVWGLRLMFTRGSFSGNDLRSDANSDRALNFRTQFHDGAALLMYYLDNGGILGESSLIAPYVGAGLGYSQFQTMGDLFLEDGRRYYYWSDGSIRDMAEGAANANIVEQDGIYETDLAALRTEGRAYGNGTLTLPMAAGLKIRLGNRLNLNLEALMNYSLSDHIDDVSGNYPTSFDSPLQAYASNPSELNQIQRGNGKANDFYGMFNVGLSFNFGYKKQGFTAPLFHTGEAKDEPADEMASAVAKVEMDSFPEGDLSPKGEGGTVVARDTVWDVVFIRDTIYTDSLPEWYIEPDVIIEAVPEEPVFTMENLAGVSAADVDAEFIALQIGDLKDDLTSGQRVLSQVQESNFELALLRNEINELKAQEGRTQEGIDSVYSKLEELVGEMEAYHAHASPSKSQSEGGEYDPAVQRQISGAANEMKEDLLDIRREILTLKANQQSMVTNEEYLRIQRENSQRIAALEQEMRLLRKAVRRVEAAVAEGGIRRESLSARPSIFDDNANIRLGGGTTGSKASIDLMEAERRHQNHIRELERQLAEARKGNASTNALDNEEFDALSERLRMLEQQLAKAGDGAPSAKTEEDYARLMEQMGALSQQLDKANKEIKELKQNRSKPKSDSDLAREAIAKLGATNIFFDTGKSSIGAGDMDDLGKVATLMRQHPKVTATITGHTDRSGNAETNRRLAKQRSDNVAAFLEARGVNPSRMAIKHQTDAPSGRVNDPYSRRVEVVLGLR